MAAGHPGAGFDSYSIPHERTHAHREASNANDEWRSSGLQYAGYISRCHPGGEILKNWYVKAFYSHHLLIKVTEPAFLQVP